MEWETVVGFEIHTELLTQSKVWCGCSTEFGRPPNTQTCPVCLGMPGSLPVLNRKAMDLAIRTALALDCSIVSPCQFERKNYYYPDLPKNYQISQLRKNLGVNGVQAGLSPLAQWPLVGFRYHSMGRIACTQTMSLCNRP